ncbi:CAP domain-containing protein [Mucilaginibacter ginsenosidivorax]|nr:CAP domain-containing protein [Mucilaginibacter ginsenosidivorax]
MKLALAIANKKRAVGCKCGIVEMGPAEPLSWNDSLFKAAYLHAADMAKLNYFSHISKDGRNATARIIKAGYNYQGFKSFVAGENIAEGQESLPEVFEDWFKSEGHCKNLMNPKFKEIGLAMVNGYWVMDFGGRVVFSEAEQEQIKKGDLKVAE